MKDAVNILPLARFEPTPSTTPPFKQYTLSTWRCTQNLKTLAPIEAEKSVTEIFIGEKKMNK